MEKYGFVYIWFDRKHKRYYLGCHWGTEDDGYICSSRWMRKAYRRRPEDFKRRIIEFIYTSRKDLLECERKWLLKIKDQELGIKYYNLRKIHLSEFVKDKISKSQKGRKPSIEVRLKMSASQLGRKHSEATKEKIRKAHLGKIVSTETRKKFSENMKNMSDEHKAAFSRKGYKHSDETKQKISKTSKGRKCSEESINKRKQKLIGLKRSEETLKRMSESQKGPKPNKMHTYKFINPEGFVIIVDNLQKFSKENNLQYTTMITLSNGKHKYNSYKGWKQFI